MSMQRGGEDVVKGGRQSVQFAAAGWEKLNQGGKAQLLQLTRPAGVGT